MHERINWKVITGPPSSGKTKIIEAFAAMGHATKKEMATEYIGSQLTLGRTLIEICADQVVLQREIATAAAAAEALLDPDVPHVFDRAVPDGLAYCRLYGHGEHDVRRHLVHKYHPTVCLLEKLPFEPNAVRIENDEVAAQLELLYEQVYLELGYTVVRVPAFQHPDTTLSKEERLAWSVPKRVEFILGHWNV